MNKKRLFALCVTLILMTVVVGAIFAEEQEYTVTVSYKASNGYRDSVTYTVVAASASEAEKKATAKCEFDKSAQVISCGGAIATGKSK